jgi:hypothetical protein
MNRYYILFATALLIIVSPFYSATAQNTIKKVTISVNDALTGRPVEGAEITFRTLLAKSTKKTNSEGKAFFEMMLITESLTLNYTVTCPQGIQNYKSYSGSITLISSKDTYEYTAQVQPTARNIAIRISDDKRQPLAHVRVKLKDDSGKETESTSDAGGIAMFSPVPGVSYKNAWLALSKEGFKDYTVPVLIDDQTSQISVIASFETNTPLVEADLDQGKQKTDMLGPTGNLVTSNMPPGFTPSVKPEVTWGPYTPACDANPLAAVPQYTPLAVEDDKSLLDHIGSECLGAAGEAVDALADLTENIVSFSIKLKAAWNQASPNTGQKQTSQAATLPDSLKLRSADAWKAIVAFKESAYKTRELFEKMNKIAAGPQLYVIECIWDGFKNYLVPDPLMKMKKATEAFYKAKSGTKEKLDAMAKKEASNEPLTLADLDLYTNWIEITENVEKTCSNLNLIYTYLSDPVTILPYEMQLTLSMSTAEKMLGTVMSDCQIRELDKEIKHGITAGQSLLMAARKHKAQMQKGKLASQALINDYVIKNKKTECQGWQNFFTNDIRITELPNKEYKQWVIYNNAEIADIAKIARYEEILNKFGALCGQIQPLAAALNERVKKYEDIYTKGLIAADSCKLDEARTRIAELKSLENSACGHFFPRPFGIAKSEELELRIKSYVKSGKCKETGVDTRFAGNWYYAPDGITITISGSQQNPALTWKQDQKARAQPGMWKIIDPRTFSDIKIDGNKIIGKFKSDPEYIEYYPGVDSAFRMKRGDFTGIFELEYHQTSYGPDDERIYLYGNFNYDSGIFEGSISTYNFYRVKKW